MRVALAWAMMEYKRSSYRAIVASTNAILSTTYFQNHHVNKLNQEGNNNALIDGETGVEGNFLLNLCFPSTKIFLLTLFQTTNFRLFRIH